MGKRIIFLVTCGAFFLAAGFFPPPGGIRAAEGAPAPHSPPEAGSDSGGIESPIPLRWEDVKTNLALWSGVVFVLLFLLLTKYAWKPLARGLDKREQGIADQISQAEEANRQAKDLLSAYEKRLAEAGEEVRALIEQGRRDAERAGQELIEKARAEAKSEQTRSLRQIEAAEAAALTNLADRSAALALELAGKIIRAKLNRKDHEKLIAQAVARFAETTPGTMKVSSN